MRRPRTRTWRRCGVHSGRGNDRLQLLFSRGPRSRRCGQKCKVADGKRRFTLRSREQLWAF
jgi:hypothetical protein